MSTKSIFLCKTNIIWWGTVVLLMVKHYLNKVLPPASPKMTGVCGGTWKYPFPFWTRFSCSPFTVGTRTRSYCETNSVRFTESSRKWCGESSLHRASLQRGVCFAFIWFGSGWIAPLPYRGSPRSPPHPWGWCEFWARTPAEPGAGVHPGSLWGRGGN